jgi:hypothetical protein
VGELSLVANGGLTSTGVRVEPLNLVPDTRIAEYYFTYGLALARLNRCGEALQVAQMIVARVPSNELAVENAGEIENRCRKNLVATPLLPATPTAASTATIQAPQAQSTPTAR